MEDVETETHRDSRNLRMSRPRPIETHQKVSRPRPRPRPRVLLLTVKNVIRDLIRENENLRKDAKRKKLKERKIETK